MQKNEDVETKISVGGIEELMEDRGFMMRRKGRVLWVFVVLREEEDGRNEEGK